MTETTNLLFNHSKNSNFSYKFIHLEKYIIRILIIYYNVKETISFPETICGRFIWFKYCVIISKSFYLMNIVKLFIRKHRLTDIQFLQRKEKSHLT